MTGTTGREEKSRPNSMGVFNTRISFSAFCLLAITLLLLWDSLFSPHVQNDKIFTNVAMTCQKTAARATALAAIWTDTPGPTITPNAGDTSERETDGMVEVWIPAGNFYMGSKNGDADEKPFHLVYLDSFWIDQTEVTNEMYARCVNAFICSRPTWNLSATRSNYYDNRLFHDYPVIYVDWNQAKTYCEWAGRRLPTEAEWEKAARGIDGRIYPWGEDIDCSRANIHDENGSCKNDTTAVGSYSSGASPYGLMDMSGNVWEWVMDFYEKDYFKTAPLINPLGPSTGRFHEMRGGSWYFGGWFARAPFRGGYFPVEQFGSDGGFRCAYTPRCRYVNQKFCWN